MSEMGAIKALRRQWAEGRPERKAGAAAAATGSGAAARQPAGPCE